MDEPGWIVHAGDCLDVLPTIADNSIDLILTDPPYCGVKGEDWDNQWENPAHYLAWLGRVADEWARVLRPSGSLYCFASPQMAARVEVMLGERFEVFNHLVWEKDTERGKHAASCKEALRAYFPNTERIIFAGHHGADGDALNGSGYTAKCDELRGFVFEPIRAYLAEEWERAGLTAKQANEATGTQMAGHWFTQSQWALPTRENYQKLRDYANRDDVLRREYDELRREYDELRRPFAVSASVPYTDVWKFPPVSYYPGKHPCEKPQAMLEHIIEASSRAGAVVLDSFAGSGATGEACQSLGRAFVGIERDERWIRETRARLEVGHLFTPAS